MWPGNLIANLTNPKLAGLERYGDTQLYVSRGAGAWAHPSAWAPLEHHRGRTRLETGLTGRRLRVLIRQVSPPRPVRTAETHSSETAVHRLEENKRLRKAEAEWQVEFEALHRAAACCRAPTVVRTRRWNVKSDHRSNGAAPMALRRALRTGRRARQSLRLRRSPEQPPPRHPDRRVQGCCLSDRGRSRG